MPDQRSAGRAVTVRRFATAADADAHDLAYWAQLSDTDRLLQVWALSIDLWRLRGELDDEPRLRRSVARVRRG